MKSPFLILFLIMNLLTINMVSASNTYDEKVTESHFVSDQHDNFAPADTDHDESACNHFCHISSHMVGLVSQIITPFFIRGPVLYFASTKQFHSFIHTPPSQPPKA
jgi:hypothetical protein